MGISTYAVISAMFFALCSSYSNWGQIIDIEVHVSEKMQDVIMLEGYHKYGPEITENGQHGCMKIVSKVDFDLPQVPAGCKSWIAFVPFNQVSPKANQNQILHVQQAGYSAILVSVPKPDTGFGVLDDMKIPTILMGEREGRNLLKTNNKIRYVKLFIKAARTDMDYVSVMHMVPGMIFGVIFSCIVLFFVAYCLLEFTDLFSRCWLIFSRCCRSEGEKASQKAFKNLPQRKYKAGDPMETCNICLEEFKNREKMKELPCRHYFHTNCIKDWVLVHKNTSCPLCRGEIFKQPDVEAGHGLI